uniref:Glycosyltransferase n=1 Tax=candidate division WOR-3 bacterium TaxID=2052148 RepID=A0A7C3UXJ4_UNCW3
MIESFLLATYLVFLLILSVYATHSYLILYYYFRRCRRKRKEGGDLVLESFPLVTVQLPVYNEKYVVARVFDSVLNLDYPKDRLEIQVLDDSDDETSFILRGLVERARGLGYNVFYYHRSERRGFKAGALREGLSFAKGEFIAIFDADFVVPRDFLKRTLPYFFTSERIGAVQARWSHLNREYSLLTEGQGLALDAHFLFEQDVKCSAGLFINFNGTCGVWRRKAIEEAGGWEDDTLTEDLDLSYRAQIKGYKILFLPDLSCPGELPIDVCGFKRQQFRWTKGGIEVARKLLGRVFSAPLPWRVKFFSFTHLTAPFAYLSLFFLSLLSFPIVQMKIKYTGGWMGDEFLLGSRGMVSFYFAFLSLFTLFVLPYPIIYILSYYRVCELEGKRREGSFRWFLIAFLLIGGFVSLSLSNTIAVLSALFGKRSEFSRTAKFSVVGKEGGIKDKKYLSPLSPLTWVEMGMGFYLLFTLMYSLVHLELGLAPFLLVYALGFLYLSFLAVMQYREVRLSLRKEVMGELT